MRPLRLLLSLATSLLAITALLYVSLGSPRRDTLLHSASPPADKGKFKALLSFSSPTSLFPPSAIISLTDDNSTFFLARPAAFGPELPSKGLSGPLWIGSGFGDDTMGRGELGCSDVPGWSDGDQDPSGSSLDLDSKRKSLEDSDADADGSGARVVSRAKRREGDAMAQHPHQSRKDDGTDDYLHHPLPASQMRKSHSTAAEDKSSEHADIQSLQEGAEIEGKVVLLKRGGCGFLEKVKWAQRRGGVALIVGDDVRGGALVRMYAHGDTSNVTIPALFTSHTTAHLLSSLLPTGGLLQDLSPEDAAKFGLNRGPKSKSSKKKGGSENTKENQKHPASTRPPSASNRKQKAGKGRTGKPDPVSPEDDAGDSGWFRYILHALGLGDSGRTSTKGDSRRPPSSGNVGWVLVDDWDDQRPDQKPIKTKLPTKLAGNHKPTPSPALDDFIIGEQDWRDPDIIPKQGAENHGLAEGGRDQRKTGTESLTGGSTLPGSGEYTKDGHLKSEKKESNQEDEDKGHQGWFQRSSGDDGDIKSKSTLTKRDVQDDAYLEMEKGSDAHDTDSENLGTESNQHEGLWVTLTPTTMSASPFLDTLLVLVVSPLVTLTVVYALLLLRSRIRRRRWRAPKSVVDRLPVRTYHTISDSTPAPTPGSSSPTTPLLQHQHSPPRSASSVSRPRSRTASDLPATSSSFQGARSPEEEKREAGLAEWRRRYGGRQKECVVCLEEYVDGVSRVMSLPCGHEFHADCITPWLVTRRRTCPICKGDVVRSLSQAHSERNIHDPSSSHSRSVNGEPDAIQAQAAETRNDSPSAARPIDAGFGTDVEANWLDESSEDQGGDENRDRDAEDTRSPIHEVGASIRRGLDALRGAVGLQRRASAQDVDRDR